MTRSADFSQTVRKGRRVKRGSLLLYSRSPGTTDPAESAVGSADGATKVGLIVSKQVGNSVVRHRVARVLRHEIRPWLDKVEPGSRIVVRALPGCGTKSGPAIASELRSCLRPVVRGTDA